MKKSLMLIFALLVAGIGIATAQTLTVTGTVVAESDGQPVVGAYVLVNGTTLGTITNDKGEFGIRNVPADAKEIIVTFLGMSTASAPVQAEPVRVVMKEDKNYLDDAIVVAFGATTKEAFTGSATVVKADELSKRQTTDVTNALVGKVAGLQLRGGSGQPGSSSGSLNIRGISSMYAGTEPLVIVDGSPYTASLTNIPQSDIESITVLKDAASAALYGARGASGVIIITTKKGKSKDAVVNFDMKLGVNSRALQNYDLVTDPGEYYEAYYAQLYNKYFYGDGMLHEEADLKANQQMLSDLQYNVFSYPENENLIINGKLNPNATLGRKVTYNGTDYWMTPDNWTDEAYRNSLRQEYNLSINGGTDRSSYYMSLGYLNEDGIVEHSNYERISARIKADYQAKKWLKVGTNVGYVHSKQNQNSNWGTSANSANLFAYTSQVGAIYPIYVRTIDADGNISIKTDEYGNPAYDYGVAATGYGVTRPYLSTGNPLGSNNYNNYDVGGNQLNASAYADVLFTDFLKLSVNSTVIWGNSTTSSFENMFYGSSAASGGEIAKAASEGFRTNNVQTLTYFDTFGNHNVTAMLGHEYYNAKTKYLYAHAKGMFSPEIQEIGAAATKDNSDSYSTEYNVEGYFLSAQYDYANKYYASVSFRRDATSYFAPEHRWGNFWSVGAAWILSKENFMQNVAWIDLLKLKASIGQQGNDDIGGYNYIDLYRLSKATDTKMSAAFAQKGNPNITWETTTNFNVGLEFSLWQGRLSGNVDFYNKKTTDLLFWTSIPESSGTRGMYDNIGDIRNYGVELSLNAMLVRSRLVDWSVFGNISHNKTRILTLPPSKILEGGFSESANGYVSYYYREGGELNNYYAPCYAGVDDLGQAMFYVDVTTKDKDGNEVVIEKGGKTYDFNAATKYEHGSILPKAFGGFGTELRIGGFDLSLMFDYQLGGKVFDMYYQGVVGSAENAQGAGMAIHKDWKKAWSPDNTTSNLPRWQYGDLYNTASSDLFLTNASYLNFQSFMVGYTLPEKIFKNKCKMRIYAAGENLWFWSARKGLDPRYAFEGNLSVLSYSPARTISGGIQFTF